MSTGLCGYNGCHSGASEWLDTASDVELLGAGGGKELTMKTEAWEKDKTRADMEEYVWEDSPSQKNILETLLRMRPAQENFEEEGGVREELLGRPEVQEYKNSVTKLKNEGETENNMQQYKEAVKKLLNI
ncbi:28S ribosomal protein S35, mitochondrial [Tachysurus ichikawai]